ncbi:Aste57867_20951 [Aphanomyces stellatus]|uniref:Aste57867_20951 protein n=1 Tax=Aphanomyces stellatus TaxID=120398 RepID=A0A485LHH9_9STRA|nr:hypothetical protein As57867_020883 [Aphanomyces stellatus]VFT97627.1 Aste57867_20951 [Aphanomyces stellatus]
MPAGLRDAVNLVSYFVYTAHNTGESAAVDAAALPLAASVYKFAPAVFSYDVPSYTNPILPVTPDVSCSRPRDVLSISTATPAVPRNMLKVGRSVVQMHYEVCEVCGKSRVVSLDNTIGLVPSTKSVRTTDRIIRDTCRCKRRRGSQPPAGTPAKTTNAKQLSQSPRRRGGGGGPSVDDEESMEDDAVIPRPPKRYSKPSPMLPYEPRALRLRLKKVDDGYEAMPAYPAANLVVKIARRGGEYLAIPPTGSRKRTLSDSDASSVASTPPSSPSPSSAPSSPIRAPVVLPNGLTILDLRMPPWTIMHPDAPLNRTQCEVCGKQGTLICCDRCPSVYHPDCLPRDHVINVDPWLCPSCLQTPFDQEKACRLCAGDTNLSQIILCDCCDDEYHLYCLKPPLTEVPEGDWFCPVCSIQGHTRRQCLKKKRTKGQKQRPQFSYTSLQSETYEDLTILDRGQWMRPSSFGKQWGDDDIRKLKAAQTKTRLYRDRVGGRMRRESSTLTKHESSAPWYKTMLPAADRKEMLRLAYSTQLNAEFRIELPMSDYVVAIMQWRHSWAKAEFEVDLFMRLLRVWAELEESLQVNRPHRLAPPPSPPPLKWAFGSSRAINMLAGPTQPGMERMQLGFDRPERTKDAELDPALVAKLAQLRITSPMSVRSILNPF